MRDSHQEAAGLWESCGPQSEGQAASSWGHGPDCGAQSSRPPIQADAAPPPDYALAALPLPAAPAAPAPAPQAASSDSVFPPDRNVMCWKGFLGITCWILVAIILKGEGTWRDLSGDT